MPGSSSSAVTTNLACPFFHDSIAMPSHANMLFASFLGCRMPYFSALFPGLTWSSPCLYLVVCFGRLCLSSPVSAVGFLFFSADCPFPPSPISHCGSGEHVIPFLFPLPCSLARSPFELFSDPTFLFVFLGSLVFLSSFLLGAVFCWSYVSPDGPPFPCSSALLSLL